MRYILLPFLGIAYCLFFIVSRISFLIHFLFSFGISLAGVTKTSVNVFHFRSHLSYLANIIILILNIFDGKIKSKYNLNGEVKSEYNGNVICIVAQAVGRVVPVTEVDIRNRYFRY